MIVAGSPCPRCNGRLAWRSSAYAISVRCHSCGRSASVPITANLYAALDEVMRRHAEADPAVEPWAAIS